MHLGDPCFPRFEENRTGCVALRLLAKLHTMKRGIFQKPQRAHVGEPVEDKYLCKASFQENHKGCPRVYQRSEYYKKYIHIYIYMSSTCASWKPWEDSLSAKPNLKKLKKKNHWVAFAFITKLHTMKCGILQKPQRVHFGKPLEKGVSAKPDSSGKSLKLI